MTECKFDIVVYIDTVFQMEINEDIAFNIENSGTVFEASINVPKDLDFS